MLKSIKIRIYPSKYQEEYINNMLGTCRFVYNQCLSYKIEEYNTNKKSISFGELGKYLVLLKNKHEWIKESHSKVIQQTLINLESAYKSFFKNGNGFPKFKSKKNHKQSCRFPVDAIIGIKGNILNLTRVLNDIHYKCSKRDEKNLNKNQEHIKSATLTKTKSNKYYVSILINGDIDKKINIPTNDIIGIDLGIKDFIVCSNSKKFENIKIKRNNKKKLKKLQKQISRKKMISTGEYKFNEKYNKEVEIKVPSKNREKSRIKLSRYYEKLNNIKENYLHSIVNQLLNENQIIVMEDLNVRGMMKNHHLAKSIQELSLYRFKEILKYKSLWYDRDVIEIDKWFPSSKLCSVCGHKNTELSLKDREWICPNCKTKHDRDFNAAINIENEGKRLLKIGLDSPKLTPLEMKSIDSSTN